MNAQPGSDSTDTRHDGDPVLIGQRLKLARISRRMSLAQLAKSSDLTKGYLSKIERDQANPSVASLIRICDALGVRPGELFDGAVGKIARHQSYSPINFGGERMSEYLLTPQGEHRLQAILSEIDPTGGSGKEPYKLPTDVEFALVLDGELELTLASETAVLERGDVVTFSAQVEHTFRNPSKTTQTRVLWVFSPALPSGSKSRIGTVR